MTTSLMQVTIISCLVKPTASSLDSLPPALFFSGARVIFLKYKSDYITPLLSDITFRWLPTELIIAAKSFNMGDEASSSPLQPQLLCSSLSILHTHCNSYIPQMFVFLPGFVCNVLSLWNTLPPTPGLAISCTPFRLQSCMYMNVISLKKPPNLPILSLLPLLFDAPGPTYTHVPYHTVL